MNVLCIFYEVLLESTTRSLDVDRPSCASFSSLLACIDTVAKGKKKPFTLKKSSEIHTVLSDWKHDSRNGCYNFLISKANADQSDVAFRNMSSANLRKAGKTKSEGIEISSHVMLRVNSDEKSATVLMTMGAGVSIGNVIMILGSMAREAADLKKYASLFHFDKPLAAKDEHGNWLKYKVAYKFSAQAFPGQNLIEALKSGEFEEMDLIHSEDAAFDEGGNLKIVERMISVKATLPKAVGASTLKNAIRQRYGGDVPFDRLRIRYKTATGNTATATLPIDDLDAAFARKEKIKFSTEVDAQQDTLSPTILDGMLPLMQTI